MGFFSPLHNLKSYSVELKEPKGLQHSRAHFPAQLNPHKKEHTGSSRVVQMLLKDSVRGVQFMYLGLTVRLNLLQGSSHGKSWIMCITRVLNLHTSEHMKNQSFCLFFQDIPHQAGPEAIAQMGTMEFLYECQDTIFFFFYCESDWAEAQVVWEVVEFPSSEILKSHLDMDNWL